MPVKDVKWEPAAPTRRYDVVIGSPTFQHLKPFVPTHDKYCPEDNMDWIMGWEYGRRWFKDHENWEEQMYVKRNFGKKIIKTRAEREEEERRNK